MDWRGWCAAGRLLSSIRDMSRATIVYVVTAVGLIVGLWAILGYGSTLRAAPDLSGEWQVSWSTPGAGLPERMVVEQSGLFVTVRIDDQAISGKLLRSGSGEGVGVSLNAGASAAGYRLKINEGAGGAGRAGLEGTYVSREMGAEARPFVARRAPTGKDSSSGSATSAPDARH